MVINDNTLCFNEDFTFHGLRHTYASWQTMRGTVARVLMDLLGHTTIQMSQRYSHLAPATLQSSLTAF